MDNSGYRRSQAGFSHYCHPEISLDLSILQNKEVYDLLSLNYVEDDHAAFRFQYSSEFLAWYTSSLA
jgi:hypothetical protein